MTPTVADAFVEFELACQADGLRAKSVTYYQYALRWLYDRNGALRLDQVDAHLVRQYLADLRGMNVRYASARQRPPQSGGLSIETIRSRVRALKRFFNWAWIEYGLDPAANPMNKIRLPRAAHHQPKAIALDDLRKLLAACLDTPIGKRDRALLAFLADTGCRAGGALTLTEDGLFLNHGQAILREKGDRARVVPFTQYTADLIAAWLAARPDKAVTIFCSMEFSRPGAPLTVSGLNHAIRRLADKAGVTGRCNPHSFRHGFARSYLENGGDLATLAQIMGHSTVAVTTQFYAVFTGDELARRHALFSPLRDMEK